MKPDLHIKMRLLIGIFLFSLLPVSILGQDKTVSGKIVDESGGALPGVTIAIEGTTRGAVTDLNGHFSIIASAQEVLVISFIGMTTEKIPVGEQTIVNLTMKASVTEVDEIVVIGYGTQRKADVTSAIVSVKKDEFLTGNIQDPAELVKGKVAGLIVTKGSGDPNAESTIRLRGYISLLGNNTPLILVDGIESSLNTVAPENIESIDVLKDASAAAIYGTRGANGVILITTNSGRRAEETTVTYSTYGTLSDFYKTADFMSPTDIRFGKTSMKDRKWDTDWLDAVTQLGYTQNHNINISGGTQQTSYSANFAYRQEEGTIKKSNNDELKMQFDLSHWMLNDKVKLNFNMIKGIHKNDLNNASSGGVENIYRQAVIRNPTEPIYIDGDPSLGYYEDFKVFQYYNPVAMINEKLGQAKSEWTRMTGNITVEPFKGWQTNLKLSTNRTNGNTELFTTRKYYTHQTSGFNGYASKGSDYSELNQLELTSRYDKIFAGVHRFSGLIGYSYQYEMNEWMSESNYDFPTDVYMYNNLAMGTALKDGKAGVGSYKGDSKLIGFFGRVSYGYKDKYNILASVRQEGSSKFGINNRWGTFPAVSVGWTINKEEFMKSLDWVSNLKLRTGYGITGIIASESYQSITLFDYNTSTWGNYLNSVGTWEPILEAMNNPNPDLKWETSREFNIGVDFGVYNDRISGTIDYYNKNSRDILSWYVVPSPPNIKSQTYANAGEIENKGIEVMLKAIPVKTSDLQYTTSITASHNSARLISLSNDLYKTDNVEDQGWAGDPISLPTQRRVVGSYFGRYYTLKTAGVNADGMWMVQNPETGLYEKFEAKMATADSKYRQWLGTSALPKVYLNWANSVNWKNFDLNVQMSSQLGFQIVNEQRMFYENNSIAYNRLKSAADKIPIVDENGKATGDSRLLSTAQSQTVVSWYFEDGGFLKIDYITLGYTIKTTGMKNINHFRVYMSGENLLCLTKYKGMDPELSNSDMGGFGVDGRDKYPTIRSFTFGASINFK